MDKKERIIKYLDQIDKNNHNLVNNEGWDSTGRFYGVFQGIGDILRELDYCYSRINYLESELDKMSDEKWNEKETIRMKNQVEEMAADLNRGFSLTEDQEKSIEKWKAQHIREKHPKAVEDPSYFGAIGGNFKYEFTPTSIGVIGKVKCSCGDEFCFEEL